MKTNVQHSAQFLRRRRFLLVLPLLVIPFVFAAVIALGGGKKEPAASPDQHPVNAFNMTLPDAHFAAKETLLDKMGFYRKADEDSIKRMERIRQDAYQESSAPLFGSKLIIPASSFKPSMPALTGKLITTAIIPTPEDRRADELLQRLEQLKKTIRQPVISPSRPDKPELSVQPLDTMASTTAVPAAATPADLQIEKLNTLLEKFGQIKYPVKRQITGEDTGATPKLAVLQVSAPKDSLAVSDFDSLEAPETDSSLGQSDGFYTIDEPEEVDTAAQNTIPAMVEDDQTIVSGATITLRLTEDSYINGHALPRDNLLYGTASISGDRMRVNINSIRCNSSIYLVSLQVYDMDGLEGIYIPGAIPRDVAKQSAGESMSSLELGALDSSPGAQATTAGLQAVKTLFSKKMRLVQVSVKAGYQVLLRNGNSFHK